MERRIRERVRRGIARITADPKSPIPKPDTDRKSVVSGKIEETRYKIKDLQLKMTRFDTQND